ncbi:MAG TPA: FtsX-like permease family protein, partial [Bryobacteraceae bacterium]|nr:FtsX-like permease family protein [Bryobacteraceae bacterium]
IKSMARLLGVDPGFDPQNVVVMDMTLPQEAAYKSPPSLPRFCQDLDDHAASLPGIRSVSAVADIPFGWTASRSFQIEGRPPADPGKAPSALYNVVCPNYFRTMGIPILSGREFTFRDTLHSPGVTVVTQSFANRYWPNEDPIGKTILYGGSNGSRLTVVGVVGDVHTQGLDNQTRRQFFRPYTQDGWPSMSILARTEGAPAAAIPSIQRALADTFVDRPVSRPRLMESILQNSTNSRRFPMLLLSAFAAIALLLAAVGIAGVVGHSVTQRTQEIGVRMALGAKATDVLSLMIGGNMAWVGGGLAIGVAGSLGLTRLLAGLLFNVTPFDPVVIGGVAALLATVALLACYLPARRAAKIDPLAALRCD